MREEAARCGRMLKFGLSANIVADPSDAEAIAQADVLEAHGRPTRCDKSSVDALGAGLLGTEPSIADQINAYERAGPNLLLLQFHLKKQEFAHFVSEIMSSTPAGRRLAADAAA